MLFDGTWNQTHCRFRIVKDIRLAPELSVTHGTTQCDPGFEGTDCRGRGAEPTVSVRVGHVTLVWVPGDFGCGVAAAACMYCKNRHKTLRFHVIVSLEIALYARGFPRQSNARKIRASD